MNNLTVRLAGFTLAVAALSATGTGVLYLSIAEQRSDATVVNLAGAQRMLSQKISKETLLLVAGQVPATTLTQSVNRFDRVLSGLIDGNAELKLPRCDNDDARAQLERVRTLWSPFRRAVDNVVAGTERDAALSYVASHNVELLNEMNAAVKLFEQAATQRVDRLIWMQAGLLLAVFALLACAWVMLLAPMAREMARAVHEVSAISVAVCQASHHIAQQSDWLAHASTEQAEALDRANSAALEVNASATSGAESSRAAAKVLEESEQEFAGAAATLGEVVEATREMAASTQKISAVNALIERIAFQTNILALNANVEAARAGEAGLGFAVVAEEVRRLAIESSKASGDTSELINNSVTIVKRGNEKVDRANAAMGTIQADWTHLGQLAHSVIAASDQQAEGIASVTSSIGELQSSTQRIAAASEESASAAAELDAQASSLEQVISALSRLVGESAVVR